jgi:predicted enzyme related to lactoylglutathione lyase
LGRRQFVGPTEHDVFMTTWHDKESLEEAFEFFLQATHPSVGFSDNSEFWLAVSLRNPEWTRTMQQLSGEVSNMNQTQLRTTFGPPTPELPVEDVQRAQQHYRDALGFEIGWLYPGGGIGAVSRDHFAIFFRRRGRPFEPAVHWVFAAKIDATYEELRSRGARIVEPLEKKPWGLRQFTVEDIDGNRFYFHCD